MNTMSEHIAELAKSLAAAQRDLNPASKNAKNPMLHNRYADLASCIAAAREVLPAHGLSYTQVLDTSEVVKTMVAMGNGKFEEQEVIKVTVTTILMHESGQWIQSTCTLPSLANKGVNPAQAAGSAITYARRYGLSSIIGLATDDDDDGCASGPANVQVRPAQRQPAPAPARKPSVLDQFKRFIQAQGASNAEDAFKITSFLAEREVTEWGQLSDEEMVNIMNKPQE